MAREVLMSHIAHVGLPQAQFAQKYFYPGGALVGAVEGSKVEK